jgi:hypothetical protein
LDGINWKALMDGNNGNGRHSLIDAYIHVFINMDAINGWTSLIDSINWTVLMDGINGWH